jgi:class 3 adenylate cyclase
VQRSISTSVREVGSGSDTHRVAGGGTFSTDFTRLKPVQMRPGERTVSTSLRLRRQGFQMSKSGVNNFVVKSIRRGSDEWNSLIRPFVADLAFRSLEYLRVQSENVSFCPYTCTAAVLFVDLCNYSGITAAIAHKGAHALSNCVNAYLSRLLEIVQKYGGDVVKFAGDAVLVVWESDCDDDLGINVLTAAKCAMEMQETAGSHHVDIETKGNGDLQFRIHCGLACGPLESEIFVAPTTVNMQRLFHSVGGESLVEISELVDIAKAGQVCISEEVMKYIGKRGTYEGVQGDYTGCKILANIDYEDTLQDAIEMHVEQTLSDRLFRRIRRIEEDFIHPSVLRLLSHGG